MTEVFEEKAASLLKRVSGVSCSGSLRSPLVMLSSHDDNCDGEMRLSRRRGV